MSALQFKIVNFVIFQLIWIAAVAFQSQGLWGCIALLILHFIISPQRRSDIGAIYKAVILGIAVDMTLMFSGVFIFPQGFFPVWLACLWAGFALALRHSLGWLYQKPLFLQSGLGAVGGSVSYLAGAKLGAVQLGLGTIISGALLLIIWAALLPVLLKLVHGGPDARLV